MDKCTVVTFLICGLLQCGFVSAGENVTKVRLMGGDEPTDGRVEVFHNGEWGTICDDDWNIDSASVVCRMVGYDGALEYVHSGKFGPGEGNIWMDSVLCTGEEDNISDCPFNGWGEHDCSHHEDAGVRCNSRRIYGAKSSVSSGELDFLRLKPPRGQRRRILQTHGFVEILYQNKWRKICTDEWDKNVATVVCGQLGFPTAAPIHGLKKYMAKARKRHNYVLSNVTCYGDENSLKRCSYVVHNADKHNLCEGSGPLAIKCLSPRYSSSGHSRRRKKFSGNLRLKAGASEGEGRLEIKMSGRWGTICHRSFDLRAANVACRELGFGSAKRVLIDSYFGQGQSAVWLSGVQCIGNETSLLNCEHSVLDRRDPDDDSDPHACTHSEEIGVACHVPNTGTHKKIRLVGGRNPKEGRVEVRVKQSWGPVCSDNWTITEAKVVCKQLGLGFALHALKDVYFFPGSENATVIKMTGVNCVGDESAVHHCHHDGRHLQSCGAATHTLTPFAGVICTEMSPDLVQDVPLLQQSIHLDEQPIHNLRCAAEENCLASSADQMIDDPYGTRRLLRFSTRVWNRGRTDFQPAKQPRDWIWHQCHGHYHSMSQFTHYDILDLNRTEVAEGHKASFCLEDTECDPGVPKRFDCDQPGGGNQGIAVGCADNYQYNIDCQWIDISDVKKGNYLLRVRVNPHSLVAESDFQNNEVYCNLKYDGHRVWAWNCHIPDHYDPATIAQYYKESIYP
uniref:protein-lysine 6-oxidase n=1 Tax=Phallusia mammillata TaxID=59560 RepID=A0A6F9DKI5_9ASCI|nr:lysyl oxidase homolog 3 [Phallusia mammillata]